MKYLISILVLAGIMLQSLSSFVVVAHYQWNKQYIAAKLCENKAKPKMHCNGKCHLRKQLIAQEKKEQMPISPLKNKTEVNQFMQDSQKATLIVVAEPIPFFGFNYLEPAKQLYLANIFHPPCS